MGRLMRAPARIATPSARVARAPKVALPFYQSSEWRALVSQLREARGCRCEECGRKGFVIGDHVVELRDGGAALDPGNVRLLCAPCHGRKTERERQRRAGLRGSRGLGSDHSDFEGEG